MYCRLAFASLAVFVGYGFVSAQEQIPSTTTAAELWNPWTWFWPYAKAAAEGYRDYYDKAQKATNELYQQIYKTNAFPWGNWGPPQNNEGGNGGQSNQDSQGGSGGQNNQDNPQQPNQDDQEQGTTEAQENQTNSQPGTGAQVEGNVQNDGTSDATANANVEGEEVKV